MSAVHTALYALLTGDSTLTDLLASDTSVYDEVAPVEAAYPMVVFNRQSGLRVRAFQAEAFRNQVWLVKAVTRALSATTAGAVDARIETLLDGTALSISGSTHLYLRRESDVKFSERDGQDIYQHVGGLYRLIHQHD